MIKANYFCVYNIKMHASAKAQVESISINIYQLK